VGDPVIQQKWELPPIRPLICEYRLLRLRCPGCGKLVLVGLPAGVSGSAFGPKLEAHIATLAGVFRLSRRQVAEVVREMFLIEISTGAVDATIMRMSAILVDPWERLREAIRQAEVIHADETSWCLRGCAAKRSAATLSGWDVLCGQPGGLSSAVHAGAPLGVSRAWAESQMGSDEAQGYRRAEQGRWRAPAAQAVIIVRSGQRDATSTDAPAYTCARPFLTALPTSFGSWPKGAMSIANSRPVAAATFTSVSTSAHHLRSFKPQAAGSILAGRILRVGCRWRTPAPTLGSLRPRSSNLWPLSSARCAIR